MKTTKAHTTIKTKLSILYCYLLRWDDEDEIKKDRLFRDYDTVLKESAVLTTFGGVLFGFLLNISVRAAIIS